MKMTWPNLLGELLTGNMTDESFAVQFGMSPFALPAPALFAVHRSSIRAGNAVMRVARIEHRTRGQGMFRTIRRPDSVLTRLARITGNKQNSHGNVSSLRLCAASPYCRAGPGDDEQHSNVICLSSIGDFSIISVVSKIRLCFQ